MAGVAINLCQSFSYMLVSDVFFKHHLQHRRKNDREVCVTVGLSSEVCLVPTSKKICDF